MMGSEEWRVPDVLDVRFEGFSEEAFAILERLRQHPHIEQYRQEKASIRTHLQEPFKRYRDDLVVNGVLPNRLDLETERNVFSRLLKNDFGAGGCHHHLWMAFYRPGRRRLTDVQLGHSIHPEGFDIGVFVGGYATDLVHQLRGRLEAEPDRFLALINPLLQSRNTFWYRTKGGEEGEVTKPMRALPKTLPHLDACWTGTTLSRDDVLAAREHLVERALVVIRDLWPLYRFMLGECS